MITLHLQTSTPNVTPGPEPGKNTITTLHQHTLDQGWTSEDGEPVLSRSPLVAEIPDAAYIEVSQRLRINTIPLALAELEQVLREETLGIYHYSKVEAYLDEQCRRLDEKRGPGVFRSYAWHWHPIRDYLNVYSWLPSQSSEVYNKPIPPEIFPTMERILSRYSKALFYVSDIRDFPDPFLAATVKGADKLHVIERWKEPSFRG